ncbi:ABC transporter family substrate-binding protein [Streptomyces sp. NPDC088354]|uniref:ABC transporter family substrate-binding protein n=1 Tax=unclassified Streptomyces TaxID=2593676 RepID=UPI0029B303BC|nr:ABC transporter family substrate-binding protein [Streptomyces sp. MI02-7b]MDX3074204.1 ABC transporter family substrate-binding protein [Streptomyces sp. MI02-7b]
MRSHITPTAALVAALALAATACSSSGSGTPGAGKPTGKAAAPTVASAKVDYNPQPYDNIKDGGTYTTPGTFDDQGNPFNANATLTASRIWFWYNPDVITYSPTGDVQYNPDYLSDVKVTTTGGNQRVVLTINPKATYNDGTPIDWNAVKATWQANNGTNKDYNASNTEGYRNITSVTRGTDDKQAIIEFKGVDPWWSSLFTTFLHPKAATVGAFNDAYVKKAHPEWGAGPYTVGTLDTKSGNLTFVRNPKWWGRKGKLDKRIYVNLDSDAALNAFKNGQVDYAATGSAEGLKQISGVKGTEIRRGGSPFEYSLYVNTKSPVLGDVHVREALLKSIDRAQIATIQFQGLDYSEPLPGSALLFSFQKGYSDNVSPLIDYAPDDAKKALDAAGWKPGGDGIREKNGTKLTVGYTLLGDDPLDKATANAFAAMLKPVGIRLEIKKADEADFAKILGDRDFDLFLSGNRSTDPFGARYLYQFYGTDSDSNLTGAGTPGLDKAIHAAASIPDPDRQTAQANAIERKELAQYAFLPLFSGPSIYAVKKGLANVGATIFGTPLPETVGWQK